MAQPNKLQLPEGVTPEEITAAANVTENYVQAVMAIPDALAELAGILQEINNSLGMIALYAEKKGIKEGVIDDADLAPEETNGGTGKAD